MKREKITLKSCSTDNNVAVLEKMLKEWLPQYFEIDFYGKNFSAFYDSQFGFTEGVMKKIRALIVND